MGFVTEHFSRRLKELRELAGLTQEQLAKELKVSRGAISYYEKGDRTPDIEFLDSVSDFFDLPFDYLLGYNENIKEEYRNMYEFYGLTDNACSVLENSFGGLGHIISHIITNDSFFGIEHLLKTVIKNYKDYDWTGADYLSYVLTQHLKAMIYDALTAELNAQYTEEDRVALNNKLKQLLDDTEKHLAEYCKEEEKIAQAIETRSKEIEKNIKETTGYKARTSIKEHLTDATIHLNIK